MEVLSDLDVDPQDNNSLFAGISLWTLVHKVKQLPVESQWVLGFPGKSPLVDKTE